MRGMEIEAIGLFGAVLAANLLTVCFVYAAFNIQRSEDQRREPKAHYLMLLALPLIMMVLSLVQFLD